MNKAMNAFEFNIMSFAFFVRDIFVQPEKVLDEVEINQGDNILDYGCGTGSYSFTATKKVGDRGMLYALDILALAVKKIDTLILKRKISNIKTICSGCITGLKKNHINAVLFFDTFHMCDNKESILKEFYRVLKTDGVFYFSDHHMKEEKIISEITQSGLFSLLSKGQKLYVFKRNK